MPRKFMDSASKRQSLEAVLSLKAAGHFQDVVDPVQGEICEHCGSPLDESATCWSCTGGGFQNGSSPVGAAPLEKSELSRVLRRGVGERALGAYSLSMQQGKGMAHLRQEIESMVEQFNASAQTKNSVKLSSERNAVKLLPHLGPTKAAIASVAQEFLSLGRSLGEASLFISKVHPRIAGLSSLVLGVFVPDERTAVEVLVNGRKRDFKCYSEGLYRRLRVPVYCWDAGATVEMRKALLCRGEYPAKRMRLMGPSKFVLVLPERTFQLFKVLEEAKLSGVISEAGQEETLRFSRKYSIARLPFTERLLRETGYLNVVNASYSAILRRELRNGRGRSPKMLAEEALIEACSRAVPVYVGDLIVRKYRLKPSKMRSLVIRSELAAWQ
jgi:hypothetical protein